MSSPNIPPFAKEFNTVGANLNVIIGMYELGQEEKAASYVEQAESTLKSLIEDPKLSSDVKQKLGSSLEGLENFVKSPSGQAWYLATYNFQQAYHQVIPPPKMGGR